MTLVNTVTIAESGAAVSATTGYTVNYTNPFPTVSVTTPYSGQAVAAQTTIPFSGQGAVTGASVSVGLYSGMTLVLGMMPATVNPDGTLVYSLVSVPYLLILVRIP